MTNLAPVPSESATCANCGAQLVSDQRYCLTCGQPCSPVRLAFLDVLDSERQSQPAGALVPATPIAYASYAEASAGPVWARRYAPLFAVASVLLLALIAGLLLGHWASQSKGSSGPTIVKVEGLAGAPLSAGGAAGTTTPSTGTTPTGAGASGSSTSSKSAEEKELAEAKAEEKAEEKAPAKAPPAKALSKSEATKLEKTTGKAKEKELQKITTAPIEVK